MTINAISFNGALGVSKAGNEYDKTRANKVAGTLIGAGAGAGMIYSSNQVLKNPEMFVEAKNKAQKILEQMNVKPFKDVKMGTEEAVKYLKTGSKAMAGIAIAAGLGIGAIVDACVNKHRANKADKA